MEELCNTELSNKKNKKKNKKNYSCILSIRMGLT